MLETVETEPLFASDQLDLLRDALGEEGLSVMLLELPEAAGRSLGAIQAALDAGNLDETRKAAHVLKGFSSSLGAARLASMARSIELDLDSVAAIAARMPALAATVEATIAELARRAPGAQG
ncbi:MAG: Hpt domain-containing protein [Bradyrhizobium sp.]|uniref:Hpt domain-containing protein n=1 Tax=Bradyrhizobium sp. TaxID=376 RepID=UPI001D41A336|nr:Hpt domain-containing protein [Bradyrhizobium sp.]MBV9561015.1 Hpt domain-containing protein [Bradyrhizobium sp.]